MLRLATKGLSILTRTQRKVPFLSQRLGTHLSTKYFAATFKFTSQFNDKLLSGKYYEVLGYPSGTDLNALTDAQVKRQYLAMVKKYHSDGVVDPVQKVENEEITKCIIQAFDKISSERIRTQIDKGIYDKIYMDEDEIAMKIYGKKFNDIKYELFKEGNIAKRAEFMEELQKIRKDSKYYDQVKQKQAETSAKFNQTQQQTFRQTQNTTSKTSNDSDSGWMKILLPALAILGIGFYAYQSQKQSEAAKARVQKDKSKHTLGEEKIKEIEKRSTELHEKKLSDLINSYADEQPPCLRYPQKDDPDQVEQLIEFTIGPDINLYEVSSELLSQKQNLQQLKQIKSEQEIKEKFGQKYDPFPLTRIKPNSQITLSLQAERCLQNIYIKVKDVADEIEETGKYMPPKIFFRYFGYVMFDIRQKPLSLANYRDTEYISLFDLFFDYYSPIPVKRHQFNEYVVGLKDDDLKMYGQVHINNRKIPEKYIGRNDKVVVMRDEINSNDEKRNIEIWSDFYRKYMKIWARGTSERIKNY